MNLSGSYVALITPFHPDGSVNFEKLAELCEWHVQNGTDGIVALGTTGESSTMTHEEDDAVIRRVLDTVNGRIPVIAGTGSNCTETAIMKSKAARDMGADGILVITPYYNKASQSGLIRHYLAVADAVQIPMILYDVPSRTGVTMAPETYAELAKHPNINGVKEASGNLGAIQRTRNLCPEDFFIWSGNDDETVPICALGGKGVISVVANILPAEMHTLVKLCMDNDFAQAGTLQLALKDFCDAMFCDVNPIPVKTALGLLGWEVGSLRLPLCEPSEANLRRIREALTKMGLTLPEP